MHLTPCNIQKKYCTVTPMQSEWESKKIPIHFALLVMIVYGASVPLFDLILTK